MDRSSAGCVLPCRYVCRPAYDHVNGPRSTVLQVAMRSTEKVGRCSTMQFSLSLVTVEHFAQRSITRVNHSQLNPTRLTRCRTRQNSPPRVSFFDPIQPKATQSTVVGINKASGYKRYDTTSRKLHSIVDVIILFHDLLLHCHLYRCVWSVITDHSLTPEKHDNNYSPHPPTPTSCVRNNIQLITGISPCCGCL